MQLKMKPVFNKVPESTDALPSVGVLPTILQGWESQPPEKKTGLPLEGFVRERQILAPTGPIPVSRATWWAGVKAGRFPQPTKFFGPGITAWDVRDIRALIVKAGLSTEA